MIKNIILFSLFSSFLNNIYCLTSFRIFKKLNNKILISNTNTILNSNINNINSDNHKNWYVIGEKKQFRSNKLYKKTV